MDEDTSQTDNPGERLRRAREALRLSRADVEAAIKVDAHSLYRWETGRRGVGAADFNRLMSFYRMQRIIMEETAQEELSVPGDAAVPRGTKRSAPDQPARHVTPPRELRVMALRFEAEALELGADDSDMDHIREVLRSAAESTMGARGHQDLSPADARSEMELHIAMLREWLQARLDRRRRLARLAHRNTTTK